MPASLPRSLGAPLRRASGSPLLRILALTAALACGDADHPAPTEPSLKPGLPLPLTANPSVLDFASPAASSQTLRATVQYTGIITASAGSCVTVSPLSAPARKPAGSSAYVATFTVSPAAVGSCTVTLTDKKGVRVSVPVNVGAAGHMYFVAHEDDDLLFMNPDIQHAIAAGQFVTTVYLTAGACSGDTGEGAYHLTREAGVKAAYAAMAGVADAWSDTGRPIREFRLDARPTVSLVFFRLSASKSEAGNICDLSTTNLRGLWNDGVSTPGLAMTDLDDADSYTRAQLVAAITGLLQRWHPVRIGTLDGTGLFGEGDDPSGLHIAYPGLDGRCYYYDHSDHYHSALFVEAAAAAYQDAHVFASYRGYNQANGSPNVSATDLANKAAAFEAYGEHDGLVADDPPFQGLYDPWLERQYATPGPATPLCPLLTFEVRPSATATLGTPLEQQPIVQLKDVSGANLATEGVPVTVRAILGETATDLATVATDADGRATFTGLTITGSPGVYFLDFISTGYVELLAEVTVTEP
jgi:GlcNAc-PI de-N-acetylase